MNTNEQRQAIARDLDTMVGMWKDMMVALYGNKECRHEVTPSNKKERA